MRVGQRQAREVRLGGMKRWVSFFIPGGVLFFAAVLLISLNAFKPTIQAITGIAPYVVYLSAVLIGWRFNRSSLVFAVLILAVTDRALLLWAKEFSLMDTRGQAVFHAAAFLVPLNFLLLSLAKERGIFTVHGMVRMALFAVQPVLIAGLIRHDSLRVLHYLTLEVLPLGPADHLTLAQPAIASFLIAFIVLGVRFTIDQGAKESGFFWALLTVFAAFATARPGYASVLYFCFAGVILLVSLIEASHAMAFRDELTGLPARRALKEDLLKLGRHYALAMVDIDHFKKFNDTYGHDVGDQVLRMVAAKLAGISGGGKSFRYGGEEFTVIFPGRYADHAKHHLEELRREIEHTGFVIRRRLRPRRKPESIKPVTSPLKSVSVTISIGLASCNERNLTPQAVLKAADKALYRAKKQGRNRVCT